MELRCAPDHNYIMWHELLDHIGAGLMRFWEMLRSGHTGLDREGETHQESERERASEVARPENDIALMMVMTALVAASNDLPPLYLSPSLSLAVFVWRLAPEIGQCNVN